MKTIMIQGTASNVGKSTIVAGLCRSLKQLGYRVCPFKAQNISSQGHTTQDGFEVAYAQYIQAMACGIEVSRYMNPVLIKIADSAVQFFINGRLVHTGNFNDFAKLRPQFEQAIKTAIWHLQSQYDYMIIEGAGSPAEINMETEDISNMMIAEVLNSPVLLVSNIEYGGAFASVAGTLELLETKHRNLVKGFLFNKYDGKISSLLKGVSIIEERYNTKFVGALPYIHKIAITDEDFLEADKNKTNPNYNISELDKSINEISDLINTNLDMSEIMGLMKTNTFQ